MKSLIIFLLLMFTSPLYPAQDNLKNSWQYRETVIINNPSGELKDYQVFISSSVLNIEKLIDDGVLQPDLDDIRFSGKNENNLPYMIEPSTVNPSGFRVRIPEIKTSTGTTISFYYGNPGAAAKSNARDTFLLFDDFDDLNGWKTRKGSWEILDGRLYSAGEEQNTLRNSNKLNHSNLHISFRAVNTGNNNISFEWKKSGRSSYRITYSSGNPGISRIEKSKVAVKTPIPPAETNLWTTYTISDLDGRLSTSRGSAETVFVDSQPLTSGDYFTLNSAGEAYFDDLRIRNYTQPEPAACIERELITFIPENLLCEGELNPEKVVDGTPEFSWKFLYSGGYAHEGLPQFAYRLLVSTSSTDLNNNTGSAWDSGRVTSPDESAEYAGRRLIQDSIYFWKARAWATDTSGSPYSGIRQFNYTFNLPPSKPSGLLCDGTANPRRMAKVKPEFSWDFTDPDPMSSQEYFRLLVSPDIDKLNENTVDAWDSGKTRSEIPGANYDGVPLARDTTYYWKVMAWDDGSSSSTYSNTQTFRFIYDPSLYPEPVENLTAVPLKARKIQLKWLASRTSGVAGYIILCSTGRFDRSYSVFEAQSPSEENTWTSPPFDEGTMYSFIVRAFNRGGYIENNENVITAMAFTKPPGMFKTLVKFPRNGKRISGNRFTLMVEADPGSIKEIKGVRFEYKKQSDTQWTILRNSFKTKNMPGYAGFWDISSLEEGRYNLRTVWEILSKKKASLSSFLTIIVDHNNPDIEEVSHGGKTRKTEKLDNRIDNSVTLLKNLNKSITEVLIPAGSLSGAGAVLTLIDNPEEIPANRDEEMVPIGEYRQILLEGGRLTGPAEVKIPYRDNDGDEVIDGVFPPVLESDLKPFVYNKKLDIWEMILDYELDKDNNRVIFKTEHFSLFSIMGRGLSTLKHPFNYPNPFGSEGTTFIYELAEDSDVTIKIYTAAKRLIKALLNHEPRNIGVQEEFWDGLDDGYPPSELANGNYFYRITANTASGETVQKTGKVVIMK